MHERRNMDYPKIIAGLWVAIGSIPGCSLIEATQSKQNNSELWSVNFKGWSPSLHQTNLKICLSVKKEMDDDSKLEELLFIIDEILNRQKEYSIQGILLGEALPMWVPESIRHIEKTPIDHLYADASALAFRLCKNQAKGNMDCDSISYEYKQVVREIHQNTDVDYDGSDCFGYAGDYVSTVGNKCLVTTKTYFTSINQNPYEMEGNEISIPENCLPETVLQRMNGKKLGDFIEISPYVHNRRVERVDVYDGAINILLEPCLISLSDIVNNSQEKAFDLVIKNLDAID